MSMAMEMLLTGRKISAAEALRCGLVSHVVPQPELMEKARWLAGLIAANAPLAVRATKESARRGVQVPLAQGFLIEGYLSRLNAASEDSKEGPRAFAEKRDPVWKGR
jgi:enoyl-CoA hydratase/carnithine racemase